jgi:hypothetical protein
LAAIVSSGSGLTANRINPPYASELYPAFNVSSLFSSTRTLLRPSLAHLLFLAVKKVISLEPQHCANRKNFKKLSKNDYGFTPSANNVNQKAAAVTSVFSIECSPSTTPCQKIVQTR